MQTLEHQTRQAVSRWRRWLAFNTVGLVGIAVHTSALTGMTMGLGWNYLLSTVLAVEIAILHNFFWHEHWTWSDQTTQGFTGRVRRLGRFHAANGAISFLGNLLLMWIFVGLIGIHPLAASLMSIATCSLANFFASDRWVFRERNEDMKVHPNKNEPATKADSQMMNRRLLQEVTGATVCEKQGGRTLLFSSRALIVAIGLFVALGSHLDAAELRPETVKAWTLYSAATEQRIEQELKSNKGFLALDFLSQKAGAAERKAVIAGDIPVMKLATGDSNGGKIGIPSGLVHHWRGSVFIPNVNIDLVMSRIVNPRLEDTRQEDVLDSRGYHREPH